MRKLDDPMDEIAKFLDGFRKFQSRYFCDDAGLFAELKNGQQPKVLIIGCCDSRVDPGLLTGSAPGDIFVIRNVANLVPPYESDLNFHGVSAGIEFAVKSLEVSHVIILGHSNCGGIKFLLQDKKEDDSGEFLEHWMSIASRAKEHVLEEAAGQHPDGVQCACEKASILISLRNLLSFPFVRHRVEAGRLQLHGWYFDLSHGELLGYSPESQNFVHLVQSQFSPRPVGPADQEFGPS